ncbi:helix-turn-helix transcriptional regulator [Streptomyces sp. NPDC001985]|uniref:helix-turn-helix transcriptional regulator n=1 Tax=Streptomyces sp. NPDC001985 TaxID=3154406 RepID=UPI0033226CA8
MVSTAYECEQSQGVTTPGPRGDADRSGSRAGADSLEEALVRARDLLDMTVSLHRQGTRGSPVTAVSAHNERAVLDEVDACLGQARRSVSLVLTGQAHGRLMPAVLPHLHSITRKQLTARMLHSAQAGAPQSAQLIGRLSNRFETRVTYCVLRETLIVDGRIALFRDDAGGHGDRFLAVQDPTTVRTLALLFAGFWGSAMSPAGHSWDSQSLSSDAARRILECLRDGQIDDVAARKLRVSLRTYRRHVAQIMEALGARSRFQAGVRAVELGLLKSEE